MDLRATGLWKLTVSCRTGPMALLFVRLLLHLSRIRNTGRAAVPVCRSLGIYQILTLLCPAALSSSHGELRPSCAGPLGPHPRSLGIRDWMLLGQDER